MDGFSSSGSVIEARRDCAGNVVGEFSVKWIRLQYLGVWISIW